MHFENVLENLALVDSEDEGGLMQSIYSANGLNHGGRERKYRVYGLMPK